MKTLQVILALGILVLIHEFGHFFFAKIFGIKVDKFYLFFDAWGVKLFSTKKQMVPQDLPEGCRVGDRIRYRLASSRRLLQDLRNDRRVYGH